MILLSDPTGGRQNQKEKSNGGVDRFFKGPMKSSGRALNARRSGSSAKPVRLSDQDLLRHIDAEGFFLWEVIK